MPTVAGTLGFAPKVLVQPIPPKDSAKPEPEATQSPAVNPEQVKYEKLWQKDIYRQVSPGEQWATQFLEIARPETNSDCIDFGCGTGRGALSLALFGAMKVTMLDFTPNCLDEDVANATVSQPERLKFKVQDLTQPIKDSAAYGYCCDVMEHIPTTEVSKVLHNILGSAEKVFFGISTVDDVMGKLIGETLHLTVKPMEWWIEQIKATGAVVHWARNIPEDGACAIYCSVWKDAADLISGGVVNMPLEEMEKQTHANILGGWIQATPHDNQDIEVIMLAGGPSMKQHVEQIKALRADGCPLVTVNGAYNWAIEQGMIPSVQILIDGREFNSRFVKPQVPTCKYLIASQANTKTFEGLPHDRTLMWHSGISDESEKLVMETYGVYYPIPGGSTVVLRAIPLMRMLGVSKFHIFGFDSCVTEGEHHAYSQPENDNQPLIPVTCGGRTFQCVPWMLSQASEFRDIIKSMGDLIELNIVGDGLISHMLHTGASFSTETED